MYDLCLMVVIRLHHGLLHKRSVCTCPDKWWYTPQCLYTLTASVHRDVSVTNDYRISLLPICAHTEWRWSFIKRLQNRMWWLYEDVCKPRVFVRRTCSKLYANASGYYTQMGHFPSAEVYWLQWLVTLNKHTLWPSCVDTSMVMQTIELNLQTLLKNSIILTHGIGDFKKQCYNTAKCNKIKTTRNIIKKGRKRTFREIGSA